MNEIEEQAGALAGVRVLEFTALGPAPFACMMFADMGADVVQISRPGQRSSSTTHSGRKHIELDLKDADARTAAFDLIARADILIEGFRPGVMERLGLGPKEALEANPSLIYGRMTGWGQDGPLAQVAGHDVNYVALTGALAAIGGQDRPAVPLNLVGDYAGGSLFLVIGCLAAMHHARTTGQGQVIDAAMVDGASFLMTKHYEWLAEGAWSLQRGENLLDGGRPWYDVYACKNGGFVSIGPIEPQFYAQFLKRVGLEDDPDFANQHNGAAFPAMRARLEGLFRSRTRAEWCELLEGSDVCFAPVLTMAEAADHPQIKARGTVQAGTSGPLPAPAPRFSATPSKRRTSTVSDIDEVRAVWSQR